MIAIPTEPNLPRSPLARRLMLRVGLVATAIIVALTAFVYFNAFSQAEEQVRGAIVRVNAASARSESAMFATAENRLLLLRRIMLSGGLPGPAVEPPWQPGPDGLERISLAYPESQGILSGSLWQATPERRAWVQRTLGVLDRLGPELARDFLSVYCAHMGQAALSYSTRADYGAAQKAADFQPGGMLYALPEATLAEMRARPVRWTRLYRDKFVGEWMLSAGTLLEDREARITYCALDLPMGELMSRAANPALPGSFNIVLNQLDELLIHPELLAKIKAAGGNLSLRELGDPLLSEVGYLSVAANAGVQQTPGGEYLMVVSHFNGPDWRFITLYPTALIRQQAVRVTRATFGAAVLALALGLALLALLLRREVARPLRQLVAATGRIAEGGASELAPPGRDDEIGRLGEAIREMGLAINERDRHLVARAADLEREVAERKSREAALRHATETLTLATQAASIGVWDYEFGSQRLEWDNQMFLMYGFSPGAREIAFERWRERVHPDDWPKIKSWLRLASDGKIVRGEQEFRIVWPDGRQRHIISFGQLSLDALGKPARITGVNVDVTERKHQEARIVHMATHDALTGLPNRSLLHDRIVQAIAAGERLNKQVGVLFIDLDRFKTINDSLGHSRGDELLIQAGHRLVEALRKVDTLGRLGGDEFLVILPFLEQPDDAERVADKILAAFAAPFALADHELIVTPSIGISLCPRDGESPETLIRNADIAMYRAKAKGRNTWHMYSAEMSEEASELLLLEHDLRRGLEQEELVLYYQSKHRLSDCALVGAEALARWHRPGHGLVGPDRFIPLAEERGLITALSAWVLRAACRQLAAWRSEGLAVVPIAVNLDARQFSRPELLNQIQGLLQEFELPPHLLQLELTESALLLDEHAVLDNLNRLRALGLLVAIDDFGTGYSSLSYLHRFPIDSLKIDRSFINSLGTAESDLSLVSAIIGIGHTLGLTVVAEGVENEEQLAYLRQLGCDLVQGYLFNKPVPAEEFGAKLEAGA